MLVNKDHSLDAVADTHPNSYLQMTFFSFNTSQATEEQNYTSALRPRRESRLFHAPQLLRLFINTYSYLHMYSRQAQVSEERAYRVSLLHISKDNCVYKIVTICAAFTDPLKKQNITKPKKKSSNRQSLKGGNSSQTVFAHLGPGRRRVWRIFFSHVTLPEFHKETESNMCLCYCLCLI